MKYYITNAIKYANDEPHLGHGYEEIISDTIARFYKQRGCDVLLLTGLDEHSTNVFKKAKEKNLDTIKYCDQMEDVFKKVWKSLDINYDIFIRTTSDAHKKAVQEIYKRIKANGDIYEGTYKGNYCDSCEAYKEQSEIADGKCGIHKVSVRFIEETNLFFRLSNYKEQILILIQSGKFKIRPDYRKNEIVSFLKGGLKDLSITRLKAPWGIDVPDHKDQKFYIWFDALINYLTGIGFPDNLEQFSKYWPCDLHVIGQDISRFHCIIWPAMLLSAGIELPSSVLIHGFVLAHGEKLSKTTGNILKPDYICPKFGIDAVRYFLLRESPIGGDIDFSEGKLSERYKRDLANDLGNLVQRTVSMAQRYFQGRVENSTWDRFLADHVDSIKSILPTYFSNFQLSDAVSKIWEVIRLANTYVEQRAPWQQAKEGKLKELNETLFSLLETIKWVSYLTYPFIPNTSVKILSFLGINTLIPIENELKTNEYSIKTSELLFPKLDK
ncbi:MAG: methionine--tRNA ligase [Planctomycetes bacterium]|nr:methionine--tRNA ligase [Planctomycetota bacterium]